MKARLAWVAAGLAAACVAPPGPPPISPDDYPGELLPPAALGRDVLWQQRVTAQWGDAEERGFRAAVQVQGDVLTVVGLSPAGSVGFVIRLENGAVDFENQTGEEVPIPPEFVLLDVQRVFFPWLGAGAHRGRVGDEEIAEVWEDGRLRRRAFTRVDGEPAGTIVVEYQWERGDWRAPSRAVLDNGWLGYRLTVETFAESLLPPM